MAVISNLQESPERTPQTGYQPRRPRWAGEGFEAIAIAAPAPSRGKSSLEIDGSLVVFAKKIW